MHEGEAGEQQSFHPEWHPSVTFTETCLKRSQMKNRKIWTRKNLWTPESSKEGQWAPLGAGEGLGQESWASSLWAESGSFFRRHDKKQHEALWRSTRHF